MTLTLTAFQSTLFLGAIGLAVLYLRERTKNLAREATEKTLADYRNRHDQELAALNAALQRRLQELNLYSKKRHKVYAQLYAKVREAADRYAMLVGLHEIPDFGGFGLPDVLKYIAENLIPSEDARPVLDAYGQGQPGRQRLMEDLEHSVRLRDAGATFQIAKNVEALNALYLSDDVTERLEQVRVAIADLSAHIRFPEPGKGGIALEKRAAVDAAVVALRGRMRDELSQRAVV